MKYVVALMVAFLAVSASTASAQQQQGDREVSVNVYYYRTVGSDFAFGVGSIQGKFGMFLTDRLELGVAPTISISTTSTTDFFTGETESETTTTLGSGFFGSYSFLTANARTVPYVGGQYYVQDLDNAGDTSSIGINGGAKHYLTEKAFLDGSANYLMSLADGSEGGILLFTAGIGFLF